MQSVIDLMNVIARLNASTPEMKARAAYLGRGLSGERTMADRIEDIADTFYGRRAG
jgi:hypothetical protein